MSDQTSAQVSAPEGIVSRPSAYPVADTVVHIEQALTEKGLTLFTVIDHSEEAERVGLQMQEAKLLIFGNPKAGTPLMIAAPLLALDLPLKALVWRDTQGQVWVSYNSPAWLAQRYHIPTELVGNIAGIEPLLAAAIQP
ncbi:MAG TPA: DUF302 domain-containing protein [Ktedonobacterales bacterium]|jgi:uncharacterized protein (DUF302 family)|nr:DUF302 domain-containing protein [Ktedonobacterales bacterium]